MHVIATAGHVDHGKTALVRALTGMETDRLEEERRRGLTIDLGFAWTQLPNGDRLAFVDVPGHGKFMPNMLAGVGPVPAALLVVAADEGWMPQSTEHLAALDALGVGHAVLAITRSDRATPEAAREEALTRIRATGLGDIESVPVSSVTGSGIVELRAALARLVARLPGTDDTAPVRLWIDRAFTVRGSGLVVTGTLPAGTVRAGDVLTAQRSGQQVRVRGIHVLGRPSDKAEGVARVALNIRGIDPAQTGRGDALLTRGAFHAAQAVDARLRRIEATELPRTAMLHIGSAAVTVGVRRLHGPMVRLSLGTELPLHAGERALLRDPGRHQILDGLTLLDVDPPPLKRRGAAARRAAALAECGGPLSESGELRRRKLARRTDLRAMGIPPDPVGASGAPVVVGDWLVDRAYWADLAARLAALVTAYATERPYEAGIPLNVARHRLELPDTGILRALVRPPLTLNDGRIQPPFAGLPSEINAALQQIIQALTATPFAAPDLPTLSELGLSKRHLAAAEHVGLLLRLSDTVVLLPDAPDDAMRRLAALPGPFTVSEACRALGTSRRVALPLLEHLDRRRLLRRLSDNRREVRH